MCTVCRQMPACLLVLLGHAPSDGRPVSMPDGRGSAVRSERVTILGTSKACRFQFSTKRAGSVLFHTFIYVFFFFFYLRWAFCVFSISVGLSSFCCFFDYDWALSMTCTWRSTSLQQSSSYFENTDFQKTDSFLPSLTPRRDYWDVWDRAPRSK